MEEILFYIGAIAFLIILVILIVLNIKKSIKKHQEKKQIEVKPDKVTIKDDVRYTEEKPAETESGAVNVSLIKEDIILSVNKTYVVGKKNKVIPGKYTLLSVNDTVNSFTIRLNGINSTFTHGCNMVFAEGDIIYPTSQNVILR